MTLSFLPFTHQTIAVCVYSSRDHRSKIYRLYTDACYAPNRGGALYRWYILDRALAQPRQPTTTPIVPVVDHGFSPHLHPKCSNSPSSRTQQIHTHAHTHILPPPPHPHPHGPQHTHTHTITHTRGPTATVAGSSITHRCPAGTHHPASIKTPNTQSPTTHAHPANVTGLQAKLPAKVVQILRSPSPPRHCLRHPRRVLSRGGIGLIDRVCF